MKLCFIVLVLMLSLKATCASAEIEDGFGKVPKIKGEHFAIYYKPGVDPKALLDQLHVNKADEVLLGQSIDNSSADRQLLAIMEALFSRAGNILNLHVYSYKGSIKIFPSMKKLTAFYNHLYSGHVPCTGRAFYLVDNKSIYISAEDFRRGILGHEISHAIMSSYFVVQPSAEVQEVLAGYVEYQLAEIEDGFEKAAKIQGEHFSIYYKPGVDPKKLLGQIRVSKADEVLSGKTVDVSSVNRELSSMMEVLFGRAGDALGLHVYDYKGNINVVASMAELTAYYNQLYHNHLPLPGYAFYFSDNKSIYISAENFRREILAPEMGHAITSSYFKIRSTVEAQKILAGYVDYQLRKSK